MSNQNEFHVPKDFYWGAATSAFQVEGGIEGTDWEKAAQEGRVPEIGRACDHYNRYEADFDIAKALGHNAHRFSIEWARIEPEEGRWDHEEVEHYRKVINALKIRGLRPYTTLWHFTLPLWFSETGGFERKDAPEIFARYAGFIARELGADLEGISTINEPGVFASLGWLKGAWPPFKRFSMIDWFGATYSGHTEKTKVEVSFGTLFTYIKVLHNLIKAHNQAYDAIKTERPDMVVSIVKHTIAFDANWNPLNKLKAAVASYFWTDYFMDRVYKKCDQIGVNYYHYKKFGGPYVEKKTDMGWDFSPEGIYLALKIMSKYKKPLFVSEAGLADHDDSDRAEYITKQVESTLRALRDGVDVRGHMYWSLLDNYELAFGYEKRFGLIEIDYNTLERKIRPSAWEYKKLIERHTGREDNHGEILL